MPWPLTPSPHTFCGWNYNLRVGEGDGKRKGGRAKWTIIPLLTSKYIANVVVFAEFLWRDLNFTFKIVGIYKVFWQSKTVTKSLECKNQISAPKRLKNGPSKIVVSKTSISALNTVDTVLISPLLAEFGLRSRYCCRKYANFRIFHSKKLFTSISQKLWYLLKFLWRDLNITLQIIRIY